MVEIETPEEHIKRYTEDFQSLSYGKFFQINIGTSGFSRLFFVLDKIDDKRVGVLELSTDHNINAFSGEVHFKDSVYEFNTNHSLNILKTGDPEDPKHKEELLKEEYREIVNKYAKDNEDKFKSLLKTKLENCSKEEFDKYKHGWVRYWMNHEGEMFHKIGILPKDIARTEDMDIKDGFISQIFL